MGDGHNHSHSHSHSHVHGAGNERSLRIALALTASILIAEAVGAFVTNSLALLSDAAHMLTDVTALVIALIAARLARKPADSRRTYGYYRFEILAAMANAVALFGAAVYIVAEAYQRLREPQTVASMGMLAVAVVGLVANLASLRVLQAGSESSLNMKGAYLEVWSDALGSIGVIVAALIVRFTGWWQADPIIAVLIGLWVLPRTWTLLSESINVLLEGVPQGLALDAVHRRLLSIEGVQNVHDLHVWSITTGKNTLTAHLTLEGLEVDSQRVLQEAREAVEEFGITHSTVQVEVSPCEPNQDCAAGHDGHAHSPS